MEFLWLRKICVDACALWSSGGRPYDSAMPDPTPPESALHYSDYLKVNELLALQIPVSEGPEHDEALFIIIHQVYELWFKQVLHELDALNVSLFAGHQHRALATFHRVLTILKVMVAQVDVIETMTPVSFNSFRSRLSTASGFESHQFRQLEFALGHKREGTLRHHEVDPVAHAALSARLRDPSLWDAYLHFLNHHDVDVPVASLQRDVTQPITESEALQEVLVHVYHHRPLLRMVSERMVDLDEGLQEWRYRHVKMVQRTIGMKRGTGGSEGAAYLQATLFRPLFPDLWAIRTSL